MKMELDFELALLKDIIEKKIPPKEIMGVDVLESFFAELSVYSDERDHLFR